MSYLWLCLLGICIQAAFIAVERRERYVLAVVLKGCASAVFVLLGVLGAQMCASASFARCIVAGLVCGLLGDVCLISGTLSARAERPYSWRAWPRFCSGIFSTSRR